MSFTISFLTGSVCLKNLFSVIQYKSWTCQWLTNFNMMNCLSTWCFVCCFKDYKCKYFYKFNFQLLVTSHVWLTFCNGFVQEKRSCSICEFIFVLSYLVTPLHFIFFLYHRLKSKIFLYLRRIHDCYKTFNVFSPFCGRRIYHIFVVLWKLFQ